MQQRGTTKRQKLNSLRYTIDQQVLLFLILTEFVANPQKLLYTMPNPPRGLLSAGKKEGKKKRLAA